VDQTAEDGSALDPFCGGMGARMIRPWRLEVERAVRASTVVVAQVLGQNGTEMPFTEDQHPVGHLRPDREHEPLRGGIARGRRGGILTAVMPASARTASNDVVNCPARPRIRNRNWAARSPRSIRRFRICCTVQGPSGFAVTPTMCTERKLTSMTKKTESRWRVTAQPTWKKSQASVVDAWVHRNCRHVESVCHRGAGGIRRI
jgi:hypothetical protein